MNEQSVNVTLEQATILRNKSITFHQDASSIEYEDEYSFLKDRGLSEQHVQISNIRVNPPMQNYQVRFYQVKNYQTLINEPYMGQQQNPKHKIMSLNIKQKTTCERTARLPRCNDPIQLQVQSQSEGLMFGKITQKENQIQSQLYNSNGQKVGYLQYDLKLANCKKDESRLTLFLAQRQNTLHSRDFQSISENNSRLREQIHEEKLMKIEQQLTEKLDKIEEEDQHKADKITTMSTASKVVRILRRRKKLQSLSEENSQIQQRGEQGHELNLQQKVSSYRNPFQKKQRYQARQTKEIDFLSLRRSKEQLGISFLNIEDIIYPKSLRNKAKRIIQQDNEQAVQAVKVQNPSARVKTQPNVASHRVNYQDCGVGTYTPLSTLKSTMKQSFNSFRQKKLIANGVQTNISKSSNLKLQKITKLKHRHHQQLQVKQSEQEEQSPRRNHTQKKSILNKFFLTNRQHQINKVQSSYERQTNLKKPEKQRQHLSVQNKVLEIKVQQFPKIQQKVRQTQASISPVSLQNIRPKPKKSQSCKQTPKKVQSELVSLSDSQLYPEYNLTINNISLNFRRKTFGSKQLMIKMDDTGYLTEKMIGNNLLWASKSYRFQRINQNDEINIDVRGESSQHEFTYGTVKIAFNDLLINKKQRYYQTFLLGEKEVLGILILGYEILKKRDSLKSYMFPQKERKLHVHSEVSKKEDNQSRQAKKLKKLENFLNEDIKKKLPNPQPNKIKVKKYLGGKNIKIGRANRFQDQSNLLNPGPGDYHIESDFSRHAQKQD